MNKKKTQQPKADEIYIKTEVLLSTPSKEKQQNRSMETGLERGKEGRSQGVRSVSQRS
jgi:hypothetical protein